MADKTDWDMLCKDLLDDENFDKWLSANLKPVSPPSDFRERVMAAVAAEPAPEQPAKVIRFPLRRISAGLGACAAALLLFVGVSANLGDNSPAVVLSDKPLQVAVQPAITLPQPRQAENLPESAPGQDDVTGPAAANQPQTASTEPNLPVEPRVAAFEQPGTEPQPTEDGELVLPRTAYGTESTGSLATRMVATVEGCRLYQPAFAGKNALFNTTDDTNIYSWRASLADPSEPKATITSAKEDIGDVSALLQNTTPPVEAISLVSSPDKTMLAQNSADGVWVSLLDGEVFQLTKEGSGRLLAWAADSSKLVFTNDDGNLFVGYPLERRIYQLSAGNVKDVCWNSDNKTLLYIADEGDHDALYIVEVY